MPISDFDTYKSLRDNAAPICFGKSTMGSTGYFQSSWRASPFPGSEPTISEALNASSVGATPYEVISLTPTSSKVRRIANLQVRQASTTSALPSAFLIIDRLVHQSGLDPTLSTAQTTNLPTAALPRNTSGEGVMIAIETYATTGVSGTTISATYTNQDGVSGRVTPRASAGTTSARLGQFLILPLQDGDTGVRSVESVTYVPGTTTSSNNGVTLFKPIAYAPISSSGLYDPRESFDMFLGGGAQLPVLPDDACLQFLTFIAATNLAFEFSMKVIEEDV